MGNHLLLSLLALPIIGTIILILIQENKTAVLKTISAIITGLQLWLVLQLISNFDRSANYLQFVEQISWIKLLNINFIIGLNGINLLFLAMSTMVFFVTVFINWRAETKQKTFYVLLMLVNIGTTGLFISFDLFLFVMFYGIALFSTSLLITLFSKNSDHGNFAMHALISFCLIIIGILLINNHNPENGFNLYTLSQNSSVLSGIQTSGFFVFFIGFLFISPIVPFHSWYSGVVENTNTALAVIVLSLVSKISVFGILHIVIPLFPQTTLKYGIIFGILAFFSVLYFALSVFSYKNYRKIVVYFTGFSNAFIFLGLSAILSVNFQSTDAATTGINGAVIQSVSSAMIIIILLLVPKIHRLTTRQSSSAQSNRWVATFLLLMVLTAGIGLPGFLNFIGQFLCLTSAFQQLLTGIFTVAAMLGIVLVGIQFFKIITDTIRDTGQFNFFISDNEISNELVIIPLILILLLFLGLFPGTITEIIRPSVLKLVEYLPII